MDNQYESFEKKKFLYFVTGLVVVFIVGLGYTWSIVQTPIVQAMGGESVTATVALCYTVTVLCSTMSPTLFGGFTKRLKPNQMVFMGGLLFGLGYLLSGHIATLPILFLTYGLGTGIGSGLIYPTMMGYSASILPEKQGISSGLMAGIYGGAAIVWSPILAGSIENKGLTSTFNFIGLICLIVLLGASFILKPIPEGYVDFKKGQLKDLKKNHSESSSRPINSEKKKSPSVNLTRGQMVKTSMFYVAAVAFAFGLTSGMMVISQASQILQSSHNLTPTQAAAYVSLLSFMSMAGRILWGAVTDHTDKYVTLCIICAIPIITMGILSLSPKTTAAVACMAFTALCYGGFGGTITPITSDLFGPKYITENYGVMYLMFGIAGLIGPRAAVKLNVGGNYSKAFMVGFVMSVVSLAAAFVVKKTVEVSLKQA